MVRSLPEERFGVWCCRVGTRWHRSHLAARTQILSGRSPADLPVRPSIPLARGRHVPEAGPICKPASFSPAAYRSHATRPSAGRWRVLSLEREQTGADARSPEMVRVERAVRNLGSTQYLES